MNDNHITEDDLEVYALGRLPEGELQARIEEHVLVCKACQDRLIMLDEFITKLSLYEKWCRDHGSGEPET